MAKGFFVTLHGLVTAGGSEKPRPLERCLGCTNSTTCRNSAGEPVCSVCQYLAYVRSKELGSASARPVDLGFEKRLLKGEVKEDNFLFRKK